MEHETTRARQEREFSPVTTISLRVLAPRDSGAGPASTSASASATWCSTPVLLLLGAGVAVIVAVYLLRV